MISIRAVEKSYGQRPALGGISLTIQPGERVALVGPNGSGKTTLMRCVLGLVRFGGTITIDGQDVHTAHAEVQRQVAYVPQRAPALPVPVGELVAFWERMRGARRGALNACMSSFGLDLQKLLPLKFPTLSGGMQQKLLAALALASDCPALVLDEPTANLDPAARQVFFQRIAERRPTLLLSSHRIDEVRHLVDRVVVLTDGRVQADAPLSTFLTDPQLARAAGLEPGLA